METKEDVSVCYKTLREGAASKCALNRISPGSSLLRDHATATRLERSVLEVKFYPPLWN